MSTLPLIPVAKYKSVYNDLLHINLPCTDIFQSTGLIRHIEKRHPNCLQYVNNVSEIISSPDYIGTNPQEQNSIEFVKRYDQNILVAVKLDITKNYLYVASLYNISESKLERRINSNRFIKIPT